MVAKLFSVSQRSNLGISSEVNMSDLLRTYQWNLLSFYL